MNTLQKLAALRAKHRVRINHYRFLKDYKNNSFTAHCIHDKTAIDPKGGVTELTIADGNFGKHHIAAKFTALCSDKDVFVKRIGFDLVIERAYDELIRG